ncbi:MAG: hypothetical protein MR766_06130 [Erysipelotrichaceae bacterium]|nr:hypothetical protein [Erysipelotrichaceae bacterium]
MKKNLLFTLSILLLGSCAGNTSNSLVSMNPASVGNSYPSSFVSTSINKPSTTPSTSTSTSLTDVSAKTIRIKAEALKDNLPSTSSGEETIVSADELQIGLVSSNYGTYSGNSYIMLRKTSDTNGAGHLYNKNDLGYISSIVVKFSSSTSTNAILGVTFSNTINPNAVTEVTKSEKASVDGIVTFTNENKDFNFFNLSVTNNYNLQIAELVINLNGASESIN